MRWLVLIACIAACGDKKPKKKVYEDAAAPADAMRVGGDADRDKLFLSVPTAKAVEGVIERLSKQPHFAGTPANEEVAKEIMRTLGRMGWKLGTQQYDVYLPYPKKLSITILGDKPQEISVTEPSAAKYGSDPTYLAWNAYSASGTVKAPLLYGEYGQELKADAKGKVLLLKYGPLNRGAQVARAERAGAKAVIFYNDPKEDPERPRDSVQRGTVLYYWQHTGDPLTPGVPAVRGAPRKKPSEVDVLPKIPVVNVTAAEAEKLHAAIGKPVEVVVEMDAETRPIRNIIAILGGQSQQAVILGNHFDAWGPGALDPHSGTATMIEIARGLTALTKAGWKPRRTIILAFWDAEEPGIIGSTEWVEENLETLKQAVAYFNIDTIKAGGLVVQGSPALYEHVKTCAADVTDPITKQPFAPTFKDIGIGSDFTPFVHHAGIATLQWQTGGGPGKYSVWHSMLDDFENAKTNSDPGFTFIPAYAQVMGLCAIRLADAEYLPHDYGATADWIAEGLDKLDPKPDRTKLDAALEKLRDAAMRARSQATKAGGSPDKCNAAIVAAERGFIDPSGIVGRPWYRNLSTGPDPTNGYSGLRVPELAAAKDATARSRAADRLAAAIDRVATALDPCR